MSLQLEDIIAACGLIVSRDERGQPRKGTGYLIADQIVATCWHVVANAAIETVTIDFDGRQLAIEKIGPHNPASDCVLLRLRDALTDRRALDLAGQCKWKATWDSYGYPALAQGAGVTMSGIVSNPNARDDLKASVLELTSPEVAAGMASPIHGFSGSPVIVDGKVVGHLKRFLSDPENPTRPAYGKVYATRSDCIIELLGEGVEAHPPIDAPQPGSALAKRHVDKVNELLARWKSAGQKPPDSASLSAVASLIQLGEPFRALDVLQTVSPSVRTDQLRALALAKTPDPTSLDRAVGILEKLRASGNLDAETGGLLGGRYKQIWRRSGNESDLRKAHEMYRCTFETTLDPYPGVNAAATALWLADKAVSTEIARRVLQAMDARPAETMDCWALATRGEALLLSGNVEAARRWYADASARCEYAPESIRTMKEQVVLDLKSLGMAANAFDEAFASKD